jgi:6-phosphogluconate dehydrogenase
MTNDTLGMIGLGRMGANMARRLAHAGVAVAAWDRDERARSSLASVSGVRVADTLPDLLGSLQRPRVVWIMLPAGPPTESTLEALADALQAGDVVVDGGNAWYRDSQRRARTLAERSVEFVDVGVSGGVWGLDNGYGLMAGGSNDAVARVEPILRALAPRPDRGWVHCGPSGSGHFAKMVHNGIEYGMMQAYAEGIALLAAKEDLGIDVAKVTQAWRHGSVIRSWLLDLTAEFLATDPSLENLAPVVADSGEGRWTAIEAVELGVPAPVMTLALMQRFASQGRGDYANRLLARMRQAFGGHAVKQASGDALPPGERGHQ